MHDRSNSVEAAAFPLRTRLRVTVVTSVLLALIGGVAFLGLLRMSALKVFKSVVVFGEAAPWPDAEAPLAVAVRTLESGRVAAPTTSRLLIGDDPLPQAFASKESVVFALPASSRAGPVQGRVEASALMLEAPPLLFKIGPAAGGPPELAGEAMEGLGRLSRTAEQPRDEAGVPIVGPPLPSCPDLVSLIPVGGVAQQLLATTLLVRLTDAAGVPRTAVAVELLGTRLGAPPTPRAAAPTSSFGLSDLSAVLDNETTYLLRWRCGTAVVTAPVQLPLLTDGMAASWLPSISSPPAPLRIATAEMRNRATWQADLFCGGRWTTTTTAELVAGVGEVEVRIPRSASGQLCLFQASNQPYLLHPQQASTWLLPATDGAQLRASSLALFDAMQHSASGQLAGQLQQPTRELLATADEATMQAGLRWMLAWLPRSFEQRPVLADTRERDLVAVAAHKSLWRTRFRFALVAAVSGLVLLWVPRSIAGLLADDRAARIASLESLDGLETDARLTRSRTTILLLMLAVLLGVAAMAALVWVVS
jgi:hypothetical protein